MAKSKLLKAHPAFLDSGHKSYVGMRRIRDNGNPFMVDIWESAEHPGYWHTTVYEMSTAIDSRRPVIKHALSDWLEFLKVDPDDFDWMPKTQRPSRPKPRRISAPSGPCVYFIEAEGLGLIKIGWATIANKRLADLQCGSPAILKLLATIPGGQPLEAELHYKFAHIRSHNEWFRATPELLQFIAGIGTEATCAAN